MARQQVNTRLPAVTVQQIADLVESGYESQSAVVAAAVDRLWVQEQLMSKVAVQTEYWVVKEYKKSGNEVTFSYHDTDRQDTVVTGTASPHLVGGVLVGVSDDTVRALEMRDGSIVPV